MRAVTSYQEWLPLCESLAEEYAPKARKHAEQSNGLFNMPAGAEIDDLVQVGLEKVVRLRNRGMWPTRSNMDREMRRYLRAIFHLRSRKHV